MKSYQILFVTLILFTTACIDEPIELMDCEDCNFSCLDPTQTNVFTNTCDDDWECFFEIESGSNVDLNQNFGVSDGNKMVFQMIRSTQGSPEILDDEFTNVLVFELDDSQNSFSAEGEELSNMRVHYRTFCFCADTNFLPITMGCLQGEKQIDGSWFVQGNFESIFNFGIEAQFVNK